LAETSALFDGSPSPLLYVHRSQVTALAPYSLAGRPSVKLHLEVGGLPSDAVVIPVAATSPAIFTADCSGKGQGAVLNEDGSRNFEANPARRGSSVVIYVTGLGTTDPPLSDTVPDWGAKPRPVNPVSVKVAGATAEVLSLEAVPGLPGAVFKIEFRIPADVQPGAALPVIVAAGAAVSQPDVILAVE
jgi:uncharacterized protein (TIGR03437 family)